MGWGSYSVEDRIIRSETLGYSTKSVYEIFSQRSINRSMNPWGQAAWIARFQWTPQFNVDYSALDVTAPWVQSPSSGQNKACRISWAILFSMVFKDRNYCFCCRWPWMWYQSLASRPVLNPVMNCSISGYRCLFGRPVAAQFMVKSYLLAGILQAFILYRLLLKKDNKKGILFTIGDEPTLREIPQGPRKYYGQGQYQNYSAAELLDKAASFTMSIILHIAETGAGNHKHHRWLEAVNGRSAYCDRPAWRRIARHCEIVCKHAAVSPAPKPATSEPTQIIL